MKKTHIILTLTCLVLLGAIITMCTKKVSLTDPQVAERERLAERQRQRELDLERYRVMEESLTLAPELFKQKDSWPETLLETQQALVNSGIDPDDMKYAYVIRFLERMLLNAYPVQADWLLQDQGDDLQDWFRTDPKAELTKKMIARVLEEIDENGQALKTEWKELIQSATATDRELLNLYLSTCEIRRAQRLETLLEKYPEIVFAKYQNVKPSFFGYTEGLSDARAERHFEYGTALCVLDFEGTRAQVRNLIEDPWGVIRDPDVSWDGKRILFAWKRSDLLDDFHLYEYDTETGNTRQITYGPGSADYEGIYLPNDEILFASSRCEQATDCFWTEVSNFYTCDLQGRYLRRVGYDQVHTLSPSLLEDGRVIYMRWDYSDRGQLYTQPLFQMNADGTGQTEFYGNNSYFPTNLIHSHGIPGTDRVLAVASGHHNNQRGKVCIIDPALGRQENQGVQLIAPVRETKAEKIDAYGQDGETFRYPYPIDEDEFITGFYYFSFGRRDDAMGFPLYWFNADGRRELLTLDSQLSCNAPIPLKPRSRPHLRPNNVDYTQKDGTYYMHDIYFGPGLEGIPRGTIKKLRVVEIVYRPISIGSVQNRGLGGGSMTGLPVGVGHSSWDIKRIHGEATVYEDGSACFSVPANTPVYFQAIDAEGRMVQSMRSWSTLMPGERQSCVGCHEDKNGAPPANLNNFTIAMERGVEQLEPFYGPPRGFSFMKEVQPVIDRHCTKCHDGSDPARDKLTRDMVYNKKAEKYFSQAYLTLTHSDVPGDNDAPSGKYDHPMVNWINNASQPDMLPPLHAGSATSGLIEMLDKGHNDVQLTKKEMDLIKAWIDLAVPFIGEYEECRAWPESDQVRFEYYQTKRDRNNDFDRRNIEAYLANQSGEPHNEAMTSVKEYRFDPIVIEIIDADGKVLASASDNDNPNAAGKLEFDRVYQQGDRIRFSGTESMILKIDDALPEIMVFAPEGQWEYVIPSEQGERRVYPPGTFENGHHLIQARSASLNELNAYRNVALNPLDLKVEESANVFPHASSNSEYANNSNFLARNAIDGFTQNTGHGKWPVQSWGPDRLNDLWLKVEFGRSVITDRLDLTIRADFPHDQFWHEAQIMFSDGTKRSISIQKTGESQTFHFPPIQTEWIILTDLKQKEPLGWCAISEFAVMGRYLIEHDPSQMLTPRSSYKITALSGDNENE